MARPTTKAELLGQAAESFQALVAVIEGFPPETRAAEFAFDDRDRAVRDVVVHLVAWHRMFLDWAGSNAAGTPRDFFPDGFTWKTYPELNARIQRDAVGTPLDSALDELRETHARVLELVEDLTDDELFVKKHFGWTGSTSLGAYAVSATSSHYAWAMAKLRKHRRTAAV